MVDEKASTSPLVDAITSAEPTDQMPSPLEPPREEMKPHRFQWTVAEENPEHTPCSVCGHVTDHPVHQIMDTIYDRYAKLLDEMAFKRAIGKATEADEDHWADESEALWWKLTKDQQSLIEDRRRHQHQCVCEGVQFVRVESTENVVNALCALRITPLMRRYGHPVMMNGVTLWEGAEGGPGDPWIWEAWLNTTDANKVRETLKRMAWPPAFTPVASVMKAREKVKDHPPR